MVMIKSDNRLSVNRKIKKVKIFFVGRGKNGGEGNFSPIETRVPMVG
jgi:hypothetical protein